MSARRTKRNTPARHTVARRPVKNVGKRMLEQLETRLLFNTIITDSDPLTATPATETLEYKDARGNAVRIVVHGDVSAEFVFAKIGKDGTRVLRDAVSPSKLDKDGKLAANDEDGRDLFHVYIAQASIDSYISIAQVPSVTADDRPMQPFSGSVTVQVQPLRGTDRNKSTAGGTGSVYLGARTRDDIGTANQKNIPIRTLPFKGLGILAANSRGTLVAGISTAAGVSLGKFMFGGAVSGEVHFQGSVETFYAGALLTGVTEGQSTDQGPQDPGNFFVGGDIRNILIKGSVGSDGVASTLRGRVEPTYLTGVDFDVRGRVGQIRTGQDYLAWGKISNTNPGLGLRTRQQEIEFREDNSINRGSFTDFENGQFGDGDAFFSNDTFADAQFLGSINSKQTGNNSVQVNGLIQAFVNVNDIADYYAVPLMAGQSITVRLLAPNVSTTFKLVNGRLVQVTTETKLRLHVGVFDPDDRLIASDYSNTKDTTTQSTSNDPAQQAPFTFTADKPGIYRFAVAQTGDSAFGGSADRLGEMPYSLQITGVGNLGLGGLVAQETITTPSSFSVATTASTVLANIDVVLGDLGAVYSVTDQIVSFGGDGFNAIAEGGDFRAFDAESLGTVEGVAAGTDGGDESITFGNGANLLAYTGSVGMIRSRGTDRGSSITTINELAAQFGLPAIGGDIQWIVSPNTLITDLAANGSIGVVQANHFGVPQHAGSLSADADAKGKPGVIDLIDVSGSLGTLGGGGPVIAAGPGGNVRYIHLAQGAPAFRPTIFGGGNPDDTTFVAGQSFNYTDDSGANVTITPTQEKVIASDGVSINDLSGVLTVLSYPIAQSVANPNGTGGGGVAIVRVTSTRGLQITSDGATEIGDIVSSGSAPGLVVDPNDPLGPDGIANTGDEKFVLDIDPNDITATLQDNSLTLRSTKGGKGLIDVWNTRGNNFNFIKNSTPGEMVNAQIGQTFTVSATNIGFAKSSIRPGELTEGSAVADLAETTPTEGNVFPYLQTKNAFTIDGGVDETKFAVHDVAATQSIGNLMIHGVVQNIVANAGGVGEKGVFEGIIGAVYTVGEIRNINIGEGVLPSGTGNFAKAGIFAISTSPGGFTHGGHIDNVVGNGADIRGDIVSNTAIENISLVNGSIINSDIWVIRSRVPAENGTGADLAPTLEFGGGGVINAGLNDAGNIGPITTIGDGGIIGMNEVAFNTGPVTVSGGFGLINSEFATVGTGRIGQITADGYGVRGVTIQGGQSVAGMVANGDGHRLKTTQFSPGVRLSETLAVDPFFGTKPNALTDLHVVLGTTKAAPSRKGVSASGSIDFTTVGVSRDIGAVRANTVRASEFNIPNLFTSLETTDYVDSLKIVAGRAPTIAIGKDALRFQMDAAGDIGLVSIGGAFRGSSGVRSNGTISDFVTGTTLYGDIYALKGFTSIRVGSHYGSQGSRTPASIGSFITNGDLLTSSKFSVGKNVTRLVIGGDVQDGATFEIGGTLGTKTVIGDELGDITVG
jgi:hypothetical protein